MASPPLTFTNPFAAAAAARPAHKPDTQRGSGVDDDDHDHDHDHDGASNWAPRSPDLSAAALPMPVDVNEHPQHHGFRGSISHTAPLLSPAVVTPSTSSPRRADFFAMPRGVRRTKREPEHDPEPDAAAAAAAVVHAADADANATPDASSATPTTTAAPSTRGADADADDDDDDMADEPAQAPRAGRGRGRNKRAKLDVKEEPQQDPPKDPPQEQPAEAADEKPAEHQGAGEIKVSTKFPTARIKRIMQADDDVGKVAQVTPVAVGEFSPRSPAIAPNGARTEPYFSESTRAFHDLARDQGGGRSQAARVEAHLGSTSQTRRTERTYLRFPLRDSLQDSRPAASGRAPGRR